MAAAAAPTRQRRKKKQEQKKEYVPQIVTKQLADNTYTGTIKDGAFGSQLLDCANATYTWAAGIRYEGPFVNSHIEGKGKFFWPNGSTYEGELKDGKRHGEGSYVDPDGTVTYDGQWCAGKRHGKGKLCYNKEASSYYDGMWCDGQKHGEGHQAWPSGNEYSGQWQNGTMRGRGRMVWRTSAGFEEYFGEWEDNQPHGEGTHIWHTDATGPDGTVTTAGEPHRLQRQLNNRYSGQFHFGLRHGLGTFYYANGAYYHGAWKSHTKNGHGRHTFEDGSVYEGNFVNDRMMGGTTTSISCGNPQPPYYTDDNPCCKSTDLSDLDVYALPHDHAGFAQVADCTGYVDPAKIFREVYNMLLRYIDILKELYARYRMLLPLPGEDPFALGTIKFWMLCRDAGIVSPWCPLALIDRSCFGGPRNHREVAPEDMTEIRAMTPRGGDRRLSLDGPSANLELMPRKDTHSRPQSQQASVAGYSEDETSLTSSVPSPSNYGASEVAGAPTAPVAAPPAKKTQSPAEGEVSNAPSLLGSNYPPGTAASAPPGSADAESCLRASLVASREAEFVKYTPFKRREGDRCQKIHSATRPLLQRQFLDGLVRMAMTRFPNERGLESQMTRLFKELIAPCYERVPASLGVFSCLVVEPIRKILDEFEPALARLFYGAQSVDRSPKEHSRTNSGEESPRVPGAEPEADKLRAVATALCDKLAAKGFSSGMRSSGDFGVTRRSSTVRGRLDVCVRIKDVLLLLERSGLLSPTPETALPEDPSDNFFAVKPPPSEVDEVETKGDEEDADAGADASDVGGEGEDTFGDAMRSVPTDTFQSPVPEPQTVTKAATPPMASKFEACDMRINLVEVLRMISEVMGQDSADHIRMEIDLDDESSSATYVTLLEYAESEIVYAEFERIVVRLAEMATARSREISGRLSMSKRLEGFLRHVFVPALSTPYTPPEPVIESPAELEEADETAADDQAENAGGTDGAADAETAKDAPAGAEAGEEGEQEEAADADEAAEESVPPVRALELWFGFDGVLSTYAAVDAARVPRAYLSDYQAEVADW